MTTPSETPETDKELHAVQYGTSRFSFPDHARKLERERDKWREIAGELARLVHHNRSCVSHQSGVAEHCGCGVTKALKRYEEAINPASSEPSKSAG